MMTPIAIVIAVVYGIVLTIADIFAMKAGERFGRSPGIAFWCISVALPFLVVLVLAPRHAILAAAVSVVLSGAIHKKRLYDLNKKSKFLTDSTQKCVVA